jgi:hypothetical protein
MKKYEGYIQRQFDSQQFGNPDVGQTVTVREFIGNNFQGDIATIFVDNGTNPMPNPFSADDKGRFSFYAANGRYTLEFGAPVISSQTVKDISLFDSADFDGGVEEAPINSNKYARKDADWEIAQDFVDAPSTGDIFGRKNGQWEAINGVTYPSKVGDTYVSNSGAISVTDHFALDGVDRLIADWPLIAGTAGFPLESADPSTFLGTSQSGNGGSRSSIVSNDGTIVYSFYDEGNFAPKYSLDGAKTWIPTGTGTKPRLNNMRPYKDNKFIGTGSSLNRLYIIDVTALPVPDESFLSVSYSWFPGAFDISDNNVLVGSPVSSTIRVSMPDDFLNYTDYPYSTASGNSVGTFINVSFFKGYFYFSFNDADVNLITRTSDFTTFEPVNSGLPSISGVSGLGRIFSTDDAIYWNESTALYRSSDGLNFSFVSNMPTANLKRVWNTSDIIFTYQSNNNVNSKVSFDGGMTFEKVSPLIMKSNYTAFVVPNPPFKNGILTNTNATIVDTDTPIVASFTTPLLQDIAIGHKYYVKGK